MANSAPERRRRCAAAGQHPVRCRTKCLHGEWWRLDHVSCSIRRSTNLLFAFFFWYLFYLMGTTLEANWGTFRYNVYLLIGYVASVVMAFVAWFAGGRARPDRRRTGFSMAPCFWRSRGCIPTS